MVDGQTDRQTDRQKDRWMDGRACTHTHRYCSVLMEDTVCACVDTSCPVFVARSKDISVYCKHTQTDNLSFTYTRFINLFICLFVCKLIN